MLSTEELRADWAVRKSKTLARRRVELEGGALRTTGTDLAKRYFEDHPVEPPDTAIEFLKDAAVIGHGRWDEACGPGVERAGR